MAEVNRTPRGWYEYFKHRPRFVFSSLDGWIGMRLRSILRKRIKQRGSGRGRDHHRCPPAYFAALFTMRAAPALACRSLGAP